MVNNYLSVILGGRSPQVEYVFFDDTDTDSIFRSVSRAHLLGHELQSAGRRYRLAIWRPVDSMGLRKLGRVGEPTTTAPTAPEEEVAA